MGTQDAEGLVGGHPLLLVVAPTSQDPAYAGQLEVLAGQEASMAERDLVVVHLTGGQASRAGDTELDPDDVLDLLDRFELDGDAFAAVLVGQDGTEQHRSYTPLDPDTLFALVDSMPSA